MSATHADDPRAQHTAPLPFALTEQLNSLFGSASPEPSQQPEDQRASLPSAMLQQPPPGQAPSAAQATQSQQAGLQPPASSAGPSAGVPAPESFLGMLLQDEPLPPLGQPAPPSSAAPPPS